MLHITCSQFTVSHVENLPHNGGWEAVTAAPPIESGNMPWMLSSQPGKAANQTISPSWWFLVIGFFKRYLCSSTEFRLLLLLLLLFFFNSDHFSGQPIPVFGSGRTSYTLVTLKILSFLNNLQKLLIKKSEQTTTLMLFQWYLWNGLQRYGISTVNIYQPF